MRQGGEAKTVLLTTPSTNSNLASGILRVVPKEGRTKMKYVLIALALAALCAPAFAGGNPNGRCYISFDQTGAGGLEHSYTMTPSVAFNAYVCVTGLDMGMTGVSFMLTDVLNDYPGMFAVASFTNLLDVPVGDVFTGISLASSTCRTEEVVVVGSLFLFPSVAGDFCLELLDHPSYPRWVIDCTDPVELDFYCVQAHGTIGAGVCPEPECDDPVEDVTWGSIKALYQ
jgi:hypothetical protein